MVITKNRKEGVIWFGVLTIYLILSFTKISEWLFPWPLSSYWFDALFFLACLPLLKDLKVFQGLGPARGFWINLGGFFSLGLILHLVSRLGNLALPFDFSGPLTLIEMVFWGPFIEELVFRVGLILLLGQLFSSPSAVLVFSALIFSASHFKAYFLVPEFSYFIFFQTLYTFFIGLYWGRDFLKYKKYFRVFLYHLSLNFGFYLAGFAP